eukprot:2046982-Rhodomonas_salina.1
MPHVRTAILWCAVALDPFLVQYLRSALEYIEMTPGRHMTVLMRVHPSEYELRYADTRRLTLD